MAQSVLYDFNLKGIYSRGKITEALAVWNQRRFYAVVLHDLAPSPAGPFLFCVPPRVYSAMLPDAFHAELEDTKFSEKVYFIETRSAVDIRPVVEKAVSELKGQIIGLITTVQHAFYWKAG